MTVVNAIRYIGTAYVPQDIQRRRRQVQETMRRMGAPMLVKHRYNHRDVKDGQAKESLNFDDIYGQTRNEDPLSHGVGFVSVEDSDNEWVSPTGALVVSNASPGAGYVKAPKYRGYGLGYLTYLIQPDIAEDTFKVSETGVLIKVQDATAQAPWYPEINDNDLLINVVLDRNEQIVDTKERYEAKMSSPVSMRQFDRRGNREFTEDGGNRFVVNQTFQMALVPKVNVLYDVEHDR